MNELKSIYKMISYVLIKVIKLFIFKPTVISDSNTDIESSCKLIGKKMDNFRHNESVSKRYIFIAYTIIIILCVLFGNNNTSDKRIMI